MERKEARLRSPSFSSKDSFISVKVEEKEEEERRGRTRRRRRRMAGCGGAILVWWRSPGCIGATNPPPSHRGKCHSQRARVIPSFFQEPLPTPRGLQHTALQIQIHKYTSTNTQIHKYTNTQVHKYPNKKFFLPNSCKIATLCVANWTPPLLIRGTMSMKCTTYTHTHAPYTHAHAPHIRWTIYHS